MCRTTPISESHSSANSRVRLILSCCLLFTLICLWSIPGEAQVLYGTLTGNVTDSSGAAIPGAKVEALNTQTGVTNNAETDNVGIYRFSTLQPGTYKVTISAPKFASTVTENVGIVVNNVKRIDASLKLATQAQEIVVTGEAPLLQTDKADVHTDLNAAQVSDLPTSGTQGRNFQSLLKVIPGAGIATETNSLGGNPQRAINTNVNGQSNQSVNTRIDGAQDAYPWLPANVAYVPPADAIEEVNVTTNSFDAEQGMAGGAAVNVQIKSGTNQFHGTGSWFHTDQNFAAHQYFDAKGSKKPRNNQNAYGGTIGGPILKDKLFFFVDFERTTQRGKAGPATRSLPTAAMLTGDFRNLPGNPVIYDPLTGDATGAGKQQISCNGQLNVICPDRIDPASAEMATLLAPSIGAEFTTANLLNNFTGTGTALFNRDNADFKVNYVPTQKTTVFGRYSFSKSNVFDPPLLGDAGGDATGGGQLGNSPGYIRSIGLGATHTFTANLLLDWNFGYTRQRLGSTFDLGSPKGLDLLKIPGTNDAGVPGGGSFYNGLPAFQLFVTPDGKTTTNFGNPNTGNPFLFRDNQFVTGANLSWTHGRHNVRGGIEWNHTGLNHFQPQGGAFQTPRGTFQFDGVATADRGGAGPTWFNSVADFLLGLPSATGKAYQITTPIALRWTQWAWYVRDQWQVTPSLTLNLGVRWEYYPFGYSDNGQGLRWFNPADGNVYIGGNGNVPLNDGIDVGNGRFLPRVGVSYRLTSSTVIRAGYGMSSDPNNWRYFRNAYPAAVISNNVIANTSYYIPRASLTGTNLAGLCSGACTNVDLGLALVPPPDFSTGTVPLPLSVNTTTIPNPFHRGYINSFNFTIEQNFHGFVAQAGYVGSRNVRPLVNMNLNASPPGATTGGHANGLISVALGKDYSGNINGLVPFKDSSYDSLQTELSRRFGRSSFHVVYTWSKALDYSDNEELTALSFPYPAYWSKNHGWAGFDRASNLEIYGLLKLPFGKGEPWLTEGIGSKILGGWQFNPVLSFLSGAPFTVAASANSLNAFGSSQTANLVGTYRRVSGTPLATGGSCDVADMSCHYFDPAAFDMPAAGVYGNTNRNQFRGPGYVSANLSLSREFPITERFKFQVRADAIGFTNTPHFANPNTTCTTILNPNGTVKSACGGSNFGVITSVLKPGGFFGPDPGNRVIWMGARVTF